MAIGLQAMFPTLKSYLGIDVHAASVAWCNRYLARPNFRFLHVDTKNERYNPEGRYTGRLPVADQSADIIFLYSVFTHMRLTDIQGHVAEIGRALAPGGRCLLTIYAEQWPKEEEENPPGYLSELGNHSGALHGSSSKDGLREYLLAGIAFGQQFHVPMRISYQAVRLVLLKSDPDG